MAFARCSDRDHPVSTEPTSLRQMRRIYRVQRFDFWVAVAGTVAFGVWAGVIIGIGLVAVADRRRHPPDTPATVRKPGTHGVPRSDREP
jgi:sulfate permease, SulP family